MMNTIMKVMMVVPVLITSCQVSEKPNKGPDIKQAMIIKIAAIELKGLPVALVILDAILLYPFEKRLTCTASAFEFFSLIVLFFLFFRINNSASLKRPVHAYK